MVKCGSCGKDVDRFASKCPGCGAMTMGYAVIVLVSVVITGALIWHYWLRFFW